MGLFEDNYGAFFLIICCVLFIVELSVLGISGPLLFVALGSGFTSILFYCGVISSLNAGIIISAISSLIFFALLWKPLVAYKNKELKPDTSSDMIGLKLHVEEVITNKSGKVRYSGVCWNARLKTNSLIEVQAGEKVTVVSVDGNVLIVK